MKKSTKPTKKEIADLDASFNPAQPPKEYKFSMGATTHNHNPTGDTVKIAAPKKDYQSLLAVFVLAGSGWYVVYYLVGRYDLVRTVVAIIVVWYLVSLVGKK